MGRKILVALAVSAVLLVAIVAVLAFIAPTGIKVERSITINKPKAEVFDYLRLLKNQSNWGTWFKKDPGMKLESRGTDGTVGYVSAWDSQNADVGAGEQEITKIVDGERVDTQLRFKRPFESQSDAYMIAESAGDVQTKVRWGFSGSMPRPMNVMLLMMDMDKEVGKDFDEGLNNLKNILEKQ